MSLVGLRSRKFIQCTVVIYHSNRISSRPNSVSLCRSTLIAKGLVGVENITPHVDENFLHFSLSIAALQHKKNLLNINHPFTGWLVCLIDHNFLASFISSLILKHVL
jgi:hypothetical protein